MFNYAIAFALKTLGYLGLIETFYNNTCISTPNFDSDNCFCVVLLTKMQFEYIFTDTVVSEVRRQRMEQ